MDSHSVEFECPSVALIMFHCLHLPSLPNYMRSFQSPRTTTTTTVVVVLLVVVVVVAAAAVVVVV